MNPTLREAAIALLKAWHSGKSILPGIAALERALHQDDARGEAELDRLREIARKSGREV